MDLDVVGRYLRTSRVVKHPATGAPERATAQRILLKMEAEHPGIGKAAAWLDRIDRDDFRDPVPPPPPPPPQSPFGSAGPGSITGAPGWGGVAWQFLQDAAARPDVQAAAAEALQGLTQGRMAMPEPLGRKVWRVDRVEGGHEDAVTLIVQVNAERLIGAAENERLDKLILKVVSGVSGELEAWVDEAEEEDDDDEQWG